MPLDPVSARTAARLCACLTFIAVWWSMIRWSTGVPVPPELLLRIAATVAAAFALRRRERLAAASLNRWDEAAAYLALAGVLRLTG